MNVIRKNIYLYTVIIIIPTILVAIMYRNHLKEQEIQSLNENSKEVGQLHLQYIETLINETAKSLDVLSIMATDAMEQPDNITNLLMKTKKTDKRYEDLYLVNVDRIIVSGTTDIYNGLQIPSSFTNSCTNIKKVHVAYKKNVGVNKETLLYICKPVLNNVNEIDGYLLAQLKIDYIKNVLELLSPHVAIDIQDNKGNSIFKINEELREGTFTYSLPFKEIPWLLELENTQQEIYINSNAFLKFITIFSIFCHLVFFAVQLILLKQDANRQRKVYENQKIKMIGTMAATTAHEIKNPLTGIKGLVQLLSEKHQDSQDQMYFSIIQSEIERINDIVSEFLILGKPNATPSEIIEIGEIVKELEPIIKAEAFSHHVHLKITYNANALFVLGVKDQLKQVILNLVKNSCESAQTDTRICLTIFSKNNTAHLVVDDNGSGMSKETLQQVFEPFYTTKDTGTGLGLFVCKRIITSFGGTLSIESTENIGTSVKITMPLYKKEKQTEQGGEYVE